ncbi:MAG: 4-hydroxythreonine-4-phosphate dehydrogenase PdxA [Cytophagales bacterium]|nr:4-hydroxythreonine-4-phosphate dehydrogenase PdxA [Cytophagales bacterium]MDW8384312.1 4-hydroxythreonine-4-phosphate dehydrogenase PdxA [Flammeovirgaceae bacterium]
MEQQTQKPAKPRIGITMGDFNGIGPEIIIKVLVDTRLNTLCTPIVYGSGKILTRYKRLIGLEDFSYHQYNSQSFLHEKKPNVINCWAEHIEIEPGNITEEAGQCAMIALQRSTEDLKAGFLDAVVTAPINKSNIQKAGFAFMGHTEYYEYEFGNGRESLMLMCSESLRIGLLTAHVPLRKVAEMITPELIVKKVQILQNSLQEDFGIQKPKIAVLGLNPHAGESGLLGEEEKEIIAPTLEQLRQSGLIVMGPYSSDSFFGTLQYKNFDAVLACYHDQGLIPFKTLFFETGVNFTAGLPIVRTSPDHGTAYDIAGKGIADATSMRRAIFLALDIVANRKNKVQRMLRVQKKLTKEKA